MTRAIREGDTVKIIDPRPIVQLDYDFNVDSLVDDVWGDDTVRKFINDMGLDDRAKNRVVRAVASSKLYDLKKAGTARKLVLGETIEELRGVHVNVYERVVRKSGFYTPGYGGYSYYTGEYDYDPPMLDNEQTHVCYSVSIMYETWTKTHKGVLKPPSHVWPQSVGGTWFTKDQLELIQIAGD